MDVQTVNLWAPVGAIVAANVALMITSIGISVSLYFHTDKKIDSLRQSTDLFKEVVNKEMADFHKKLCEIQSGIKGK